MKQENGNEVTNVIEMSSWRVSAVLVILGLICTMALCAVPCSATEVWSEDFSHGLENWVHDANANADDGTLRCSSSSEVYRLCNLSCGAWSFDVLDIGEWQSNWGPGLYVYFISSHPEGQVQTYYCLRITKGTAAAGLKYIYAITRMYEDTATTLASADGMEGSDFRGVLHHIKVTRTPAGHMSVYVNGTLMVEATDTIVSTSECFRILLKYDYAIDNIVVDDAVDRGIRIELLAIGGGIAAVVLVTVVIVKRR